MAKPKASKATRENIQDLDRDELLALCGSLIDSRNSTKQVSEILKRDEQLRGTMMPAAATMMDVLAERAGLGHRPEVRSMIEALGNGTYIQWAKEEDFSSPQHLPADAENIDDPRSGDAEMILGAKLHDALVSLTDPCSQVNMPKHIQAALHELATTVDSRLNAAIEEGFKDVPGAQFTPVSLDGDQAPDEISSFCEVQHEIHDMLTDLDFGMMLLRTDLRAGMYRNIIRRLSLLGRAINDAVKKEREQLRSSGDLVSEEAPF